MARILTYSYSGASSSSEAGSTGNESGADELSRPVASLELNIGAKAAAARSASKSVVEKDGPSGGHDAETSGSADAAEYAPSPESKAREVESVEPEYRVPDAMTEGCERDAGSDEVGAEDMVVAGVAAASAKVEEEEGMALEEAEEVCALWRVDEEEEEEAASDLERSAY